MSAVTKSYSWIICDGCHAVFERPALRVADLRTAAAGEGWRHERKKYATSNWFAAFDFCPSCEVPA